MATLKMGDDLKKAILNLIYPVGSIYISITATNPGSTIGGTWVAWGSGRVPVGVDTKQTEFNAVNKTGGAKTVAISVNQMPSHTHTQAAHKHYGLRWGPNENEPITLNAGSAVGYNLHYTGGHNYQGDAIATAPATPVINNTGGGAAHNNLQPYITCYMWKRTA